MTSGHSLFAVVNGRCVEDPRSMASDLTGSSLLGPEIASNRDIIGIALANLIVSPNPFHQASFFFQKMLLHLSLSYKLLMPQKVYLPNFF